MIQKKKPRKPIKKKPLKKKVVRKKKPVVVKKPKEAMTYRGFDWKPGHLKEIFIIAEEKGIKPAAVVREMADVYIKRHHRLLRQQAKK